jgi:hypothetical protein
MSVSDHITINIVLDGKPFGTRYWPAVPRIGEVILLRDPKRESDKLYPATCKYVVWGLFDDGKRHGELECEIEVEWRPVV